MKTYTINGNYYKNLVFVTDGDMAVSIQAGLQLGGYKAELLGDNVRGKDGWRVVIGIEKKETH